MPRRPIGTNCWLALATCVVMAVCAASSSIGSRLAGDVSLRPDTPSRFALEAPGPRGLAMEAAQPGRMFLETECSGIIEESEGEGFDSSSILVSPALFPPDDPAGLLHPPPPGRLISRIVALPLRC